MSSNILSYVDNVVATYDAANTEAVYQNVKVVNDIEATTLDISGVTTLSELHLAGYKFPTVLDPAPATDDYLSYNSVTKKLEFKNFNAAGVTISGLGGLILPPTKSNGTILHMANSASEIVADPGTEYTVIDGKPTVLYTDLNLTDRMLISVDKPAGTGLYKLPLVELIRLVEDKTVNVTSIKDLLSNTAINAKNTEVEITSDDGSVERISTFTDTGLTLHGDLFFNTDSDVGANGSIELITNGFLFRRYGNSLDFDIDGTQNFVVRNDQLQLGVNFNMANNAYIDLDTYGSIDIMTNASLIINSAASLDVSNNVTLDQSLTYADNVEFNALTLHDSTDATSQGVAPVVMLGGASIDKKLYVGTEIITTDLNASNSVSTSTINSADINAIDINATNDIYAANAIFSSGSIVTSSIAYKENINIFENGLNYIMNMKPVSFDRKNKISKNEIGFIAEEMESILPNIVKSGHGVKGIQYDQIIPILVSAVQEQQKKIDELENKIK